MTSGGELLFISGEKGEAPRQLYQLEHLVDLDINTTQHQLDGLLVSGTGQRLHCSYRARIDPVYRREIQNQFAVSSVQFPAGFLQVLDHVFAVNSQPGSHHCHMETILTIFVVEKHWLPLPGPFLDRRSKTALPIHSPAACADLTARKDHQKRS